MTLSGCPAFSASAASFQLFLESSVSEVVSLKRRAPARSCETFLRRFQRFAFLDDLLPLGGKNLPDKLHPIGGLFLALAPGEQEKLLRSAQPEYRRRSPGWPGNRCRCCRAPCRSRKALSLSVCFLALLITASSCTAKRLPDPPSTSAASITCAKTTPLSFTSHSICPSVLGCDRPAHPESGR